MVLFGGLPQGKVRLVLLSRLNGTSFENGFVQDCLVYMYSKYAVIKVLFFMLTG